MTTAEAPRFAHDCERCTFLGRDREYDVYVCPQRDWPTILLRFASDEENYHSGAHLIDRLPRPMQDRAAQLMEAMR